MAKIDNLKYGSNTVDYLQFDSNEVSTLVLPNGDYWEKETLAPSFELSIYGVDTDGNFFIDKSFTASGVKPAETSNLKVCLSSPSSIVLHIKGENYGDALVSSYYSANGYTDTGLGIHSTGDHYQTWKWASIDNKMIVFNRANGLGNWQGGYSNENYVYPGFMYSKKEGLTLESDGEYHVSNSSNPSLAGDYYLKIYTTINENVINLVRPYMSMKVVRVPSAGYSSQAKFMTFPYTFDSPTYIDDPYFLLLKQGTSGITYTDFSSTSISNSELSLRAVKDGTLDYHINYTIEPNNTDSLREWSILSVYGDENLSNITSNLSYNQKKVIINYLNDGARYLYPCCMLHFIQETPALNRVYYGLSFQHNYSNFDDIYNNTLSTNASYNTFFETCSSKIITARDPHITLEIGYNREYMAWANDAEYYPDLTSLTYTQVSDNYIWGDKSYTIIQINGNSFNRITRTKINFNRRTVL